jgi:hypothetical protein
VIIEVIPEGKINILGDQCIGYSKQKIVYVHVSYSERFPRFHCTVPKLLIRKRYYVLFLMPVFIIQVTKLPPSTSMHFAARVRTWLVARLYSVQCTVQ